MNRPAHRRTPPRFFTLLIIVAIGTVIVIGNRASNDDPVSPTLVQRDDAQQPPLDATTYRVQLPPLDTQALTDAERSERAIEAVQAVGPAVVVVHRAAEERLFERRSLDEGERIGSGVVVHEDGYIIASLRTTGADGAIRVTYSTGETVEAELVRIDEALQLVLLKVDDRPPAVASLAAYAPRPGEPVLAIGSPLEDFSSTVTGGVIGAVGVTMPATEETGSVLGVMQHDAATNQGNEGGPLVDLNGQIVGINIGTISFAGDEIVQGWSFAIPVTSLGPLLNDLD